MPGDKSISHRGLILGALAVGETLLEGLSEGDDVLRTAAAMGHLGARVDREGDHVWRVRGVGVGGLREPVTALDMGNSGTGMRLLMGVVSAQPMATQFVGDISLSGRPMDRVITPLKGMGARFAARRGSYPPITVIGTGHPMPIEYRLPMASAQVKSAVLLAGLNAPGVTTVIEPAPSRDHTERMLEYFGADIDVRRNADGETVIGLNGQPELQPRDLKIPGDPSSAAFPLVAALIAPESRVTVNNVCVNPLRAGLFQTLRDMGADLTIEPVDRGGLEPVANITARTSTLRGIDVPVSRAPSMIDEFPVLAVAAACAEGTTVMRGLAELRVKESDRLAAMEAGLKACGVAVEGLDDGLVIQGRGRPPRGGARVSSRDDHRIAMSFLVLGQATGESVEIDDAAMIETSFPGFARLMNGLGGAIESAAKDGESS